MYHYLKKEGTFMAGNDLAMRFTEDKYATKNEVARELKISSVDTF